MSFLKPSTPTVAAPVLPTAPPPVLAPQGTKSGAGAKNQRQTVLGADDIANPAAAFGAKPNGTSTGGATLLGT